MDIWIWTWFVIPVLSFVMGSFFTYALTRAFREKEQEPERSIKLFLDDERDPPLGDWVVVRNARDAWEIIKSGIVAEISFDHDLGEGSETGYKLACKIEDWAYHGLLKPMKWYVHSSNPVGVANITLAMNGANKFWEVGDD